jgi:hypothetical protein
MGSAEEPGLFQIRFADQEERNPIPVFENHTNVISGAAKAAPTGETRKAIPDAARGLVNLSRCRGRVLVYAVMDAGDTLESEESQWEIPIIIRDENTGKLVGRTVLTQENMTGFTQAGTVDVVCAAGVPARLAYKDVPRGLTYEIDPNEKVRAYLGDDTA